MAKNKEPDHMSFTIDVSSKPTKKKVVSKQPKEGRRQQMEDPEAVDAAQDALRRKRAKAKKKRLEEAKENIRKNAEKRSKDLLPALVEEPKQRKLSKFDKTAVTSIIGDDAETIQQLLEQEDTERATDLLNRRLIQTLIDLLPQLETGIRQSNGRYGVHSLNGTIQTIRELVIDLQARQDRGAVGMQIVESIIRPAFLDIATQIVTEYATVLSDMKDLVPEGVYARVRQSQMDSRGRVANVINSKYEEIKSQTVQALQR